LSAIPLKASPYSLGKKDFWTAFRQFFWQKMLKNWQKMVSFDDFLQVIFQLCDYRKSVNFFGNF
jgi:hypothetical protein